MARIRSIKPEFWTDSVIVGLPVMARLLYIGLWNFADDDGRFADEPNRIRMQVLPADDVDVTSLLDLLEAAGRLELHDGEKGRFWVIPKFLEHQKIDHPSKSKFPAASRKRCIPAAARRMVALKYGCKPGGEQSVECFYCGSPGRIYWPQTRAGTPGGWVHFNLEIDHVTAESSGGSSDANNLVLACRGCNRSKGFAEFEEFIATIRASSRALAPEGSGVEGSGGDPGMEGSGEEARQNLPTAPVFKPTGIERFETPTKPRPQWLWEDWLQWAQFTRQDAGLAPDRGVPIHKMEEWWLEVTKWTDGAIQPLCDAFLAFGEDKFWQSKKPPLPIRGFLSQWEKYMPIKQVKRAS